MLKIVYPICCGIDVHKTFVVACIASTNEVGMQGKIADLELAIDGIITPEQA